MIPVPRLKDEIANHLLGKSRVLGTVASPSDVSRGRKKVVQQLARDLDPTQREAVMTILEKWKEGESEDELRRLLGRRMSKKTLAKLKPESQLE